MKRIVLLSDTHGHLPSVALPYFDTCDEIWHAGDIGNLEIYDQLAALKPLRAVYGNIDGQDIRVRCPKNHYFEIEGIRVWMTHIGGYPPRYTAKLIPLLERYLPTLFICGHSHILKVIPDKKRGILHMNPGAAGFQGFHKVKTMLRFNISDGKITSLEAIEMGLRGRE